MSRNDKFLLSFKQFLNHNFGLYSTAIYNTCQKLDYQDNRGSFHKYFIQIPSKYFHILDECYSEPDGDDYKESLCLLDYNIGDVNNAEMHKRIVKKLKIAASFKRILTTFYEPFHTSPQNNVQIANKNIEPKNYCSEYNFHMIPGSDNNVHRLKHILCHWLTENHSIRSEDHLYSCISMDYVDAMKFDDEFKNLNVSVCIQYMNGNPLPFPINFSHTDTIKQLKNENLYLNRKNRSIRNELVSIENSYQRRVVRLQRGIKDKEEKYNRDVTKLLEKSTADNQHLTKKIKQYYALGEPEMCPVCYDPIKVNDLFVSGCGHYLCNSCADGCIKTTATCPLCREPIYKEQNIDNINNEVLNDLVTLLNEPYDESVSL